MPRITITTTLDLELAEEAKKRGINRRKALEAGILLLLNRKPSDVTREQIEKLKSKIEAEKEKLKEEMEAEKNTEPPTKRSRLDALFGLITLIGAKKENGAIPIEEIIKASDEDEEPTKHLIETLKMQGLVYEPTKNYLKLA